MKHTAVEWLVEDLQGRNILPNDLILFKFSIEQAKEMEKEQIRKAYLVDVYNAKYGFEQYYNDNFKTK